MAHALAAEPAYHRLTVPEFLDLNLGDAKAELDDGYIRMMAGGSEPHARVARNFIFVLTGRLRGSGCGAYGSDMAARTGDRSIRFPDVSVYCRDTMRREFGAKLLGDPRVVVEVLSTSTKRYDALVKLPEYQALSGVTDILLVDTEAERVRHVRRTGPEGWADDLLPKGADVTLTSLGVTLPHDEIFADDLAEG